MRRTNSFIFKISFFVKMPLFVSIIPYIYSWLKRNPKYPADNYMFKVNNRNTRTRCKIWTYFTPCCSVSIVNFGQANAGWAL